MGSNGHQSIVEVRYHTKQNLSEACCDIIEDLLRKAYDEEDPFLTAPQKCSKYTQTARVQGVNTDGGPSKGLFGFLFKNSSH